MIYLALPGNTVYLLSLDSKESVRLLTAESNAIYADPGFLLFFRQGSLLVQRFDPMKGELLGDAIPISQDVSLAATNANMGATVSQTGVLVIDRRRRPGSVAVDRSQGHSDCCGYRAALISAHGNLARWKDGGGLENRRSA